MVANQKVTGRASSIPVGIGLGILLSVAITLLLSCLLAWLVLGGRIGESGMGYGIMGILLIASLAGSALAILRVKHRKLLVGLAAGIGYLAVLLMCTALFFGGQYQGIGVTAVVILCGSLAASLLGARDGKGRKKSTRKMRSR